MNSGKIGLSARITITMLVILAASIAACFTIVYRNVATVTGDAALREVEKSNVAVATHVKAELERDLQIARDLATHATALVENGVTDRAAHGAIARETLEANPVILAARYAWEPTSRRSRRRFRGRARP